MNLLDATGIKILAELKNDAKISLRELGKKVNLSIPATRERIKRMEEECIIERYTISLNLEKTGFPVRGILAFSTDYNNPDPYLTRILEDIPEVQRWWSVTGDNDYYLEIVARSLTHMEELLTMLARHGKISTSVMLSWKEQKGLPL